MPAAKIAPAVPHVLHMPSHIFTRLGLEQQSIDLNKAAHDAAVAYVRKTLGDGGYDSETVHTMDYVEYAYLQTAQDGKAKQVRDELLAHTKSAEANLPTATRWRRSRRAMRSSATTMKWRLRSRRRRSASLSTNSRRPRRRSRSHARRAPRTPATSPRQKPRLANCRRCATSSTRRGTRIGAAKLRSSWTCQAADLDAGMDKHRRLRHQYYRPASCSPTCCSKPGSAALQTYLRNR